MNVGSYMNSNTHCKKEHIGIKAEITIIAVIQKKEVKNILSDETYRINQINITLLSIQWINGKCSEAIQSLPCFQCTFRYSVELGCTDVHKPVCAPYHGQEFSVIRKIPGLYFQFRRRHKIQVDEGVLSRKIQKS